MTRIRQNVFSGEGNPNAAGGGEAQVALSNQRVVESEQDLARIVGGLATQSAKDHRDTHCGGQALTGYVSDDSDERAVRCGGYKEKITAYLAGRQINGFHLKTGCGTRRALKQELLNCTGGMEFRGKRSTSSCGIDHFGAKKRICYRCGCLQSNGV